MPHILIVGPLMPDLVDELDSRFGAAALDDLTEQNWERFSRQFDTLKNFTLAVTTGRTGVPSWLMDRLPCLRAIVNFGVGYDSTDVPAATERSIVVANTPDVLTDCVADAAVGLVISTLRRLPAADRFVRAGQWTGRCSFPLATKVSGKRFGILGLGRIGQATASRLEAFGGTISYHNRNRRDDVLYTYYSTPEALAAVSDVLIVTAAGGPASQDLVDSTVLRALGSSGFLINVGRGSIVTEVDLIHALESGEIAGAGLDTFAQEPKVPEALLTRDDVVLLPHLASGTLETRAAMGDLVLQNVDHFLATGQLITPVNS